jgi:hypothetical protein
VKLLEQSDGRGDFWLIPGDLGDIKDFCRAVVEWLIVNRRSYVRAKFNETLFFVYHRADEAAVSAYHAAHAVHGGRPVLR